MTSRAKNPYIKAANKQYEYTLEQVEEIQRCMNDPVYFVQTYCKIQHPVRGAIAFDLYDYQIDMLEAYHKKKSVVVLSARQTGKAVHVDTKIPTPTGWTTMGDIEVGDQVLGADGKPTTVKWVSGIHTPATVYKVHFSTGESVVACADHQWEVEWKHRKDPQIVTTQQMVDAGVTIGNKNESKFKIKTTEALQLHEVTLPIDPYTLGVWLGDGHSAQGRITLHESDAEIVNWIPYKTKIRTYDYYPNITTTTVYGMEQLLRENNLQNNKHIPIEYLRSSHKQRLKLLQGLMDTDGTVDGLGRGQCDITLSNKQLAKDVFHLIATLGLKASFKERTVGSFVRYEIKFSAYRDECPVFRLQRKLNLMKQSPHSTRKYSTKKRSIQKIERVDSVPMQCIGVDNMDNLFLLGESCIPTHNSTVSSMFLLWFAMFHEDKTILIASNKNDTAMEMIVRIQYAYQHMPMWLKCGVTDDGWNKHSMKFDNESRIISTATSEDSGRGLSISLLYLDEFAFVPANIAEPFWTAITPTLSTGGDCIMSSTPNGDTNIFAQIWRGAQVDANGFHPIRVRWDQPPGRDEEFKEEQIARIGQRKWQQEYECEFLSSDALLIDSIVLSNLTKAIEDITPKFRMREVVFWKRPVGGTTYLVGVDPSTGSGSDFTVFEVFEFPSMTQVAEFRSDTMSSADAYIVLKNLLRHLESTGSTVYFSIENNGVGEGMIALYEADEHPPEFSEFVSETGKGRYGMTTTKKSKMRACLNLKEMVEKNTFKIVSHILVSELKEYTRKAGAYAARLGSTDDCISACLIIMRMLLEIGSYEQAVFDKLHYLEDESWTDDDFSDDDSAPLPISFM